MAIRNLDDMLKAKAVLLYILDKTGSLDIFHIFKILYFADRDHLSRYGRRILSDDFFALPNGPVPTVLYDCIKHIQKKNNLPNKKLQECRLLIDSICIGSEDASNYVFGHEKPDLDELSETDIKCIDKSIKENKNIPFDALSKKSHDSAYNKAWRKNGIKRIDIIDMAEAGGANDGMQEYIREMQFIDEALCHQ